MATVSSSSSLLAVSARSPPAVLALSSSRRNTRASSLAVAPGSRRWRCSSSSLSPPSLSLRLLLRPLPPLTRTSPSSYHHYNRKSRYHYYAHLWKNPQRDYFVCAIGCHEAEDHRLDVDFYATPSTAACCVSSCDATAAGPGNAEDTTSTSSFSSSIFVRSSLPISFSLLSAQETIPDNDRRNERNPTTMSSFIQQIKGLVMSSQKPQRQDGPGISHYFSSSLLMSRFRGGSGHLVHRNNHHPGPYRQIDLLPAHYRRYQQRRHYLYLPTSWTELKLRISAAFHKRERILHVVVRDRLARLKGNSGAAYRKAVMKLTSSSSGRTSQKAEAAAMWFARQSRRRRAQFKDFRYRAYRRQSRMRERAQVKFQVARVRLSQRSRRYLGELRSRGRGLIASSGGMSRVAASVLQRKAVVLEEYADIDSWFDGLGRPLTSTDETGRFVNPWQSQSTDGVHSPLSIIRWRIERLQREYNLYGWKVFLPIHWRNQYAHEFPGDENGDGHLEASAKEPTGEETTTSQGFWLEMCRRIPSSAFLPPYNSGTTTPIVDLPLSFPVPTDPSIMSFTWLGHATCLLQSQGSSVLFDPMLSRRAGPWQNLPVGMCRDLDPACEVGDLPDTIDVCCVSHDHYDHLDRDTAIDLAARVRLWVVPLGIAEFLEIKCGIPRGKVIELEWWQSARLIRAENSGGVEEGEDTSMAELRALQSWRIAEAPVHPARQLGFSGIENTLAERSRFETGTVQSNSNASASRSDEDDGVVDDGGSIWITCCPAQHWASRTFFDRNFRLWCSFAVVFEQGKNQNTFYFGGDSALPSIFPLFEQISDYVGPIHLSALPIGAYQPDYYMRDAHMNPEEALQVHKKLASKCSVGIHWGSFPLSEEPMDEPPRWLAEATAKEPLLSAPFGIVPHGGRLDVVCRTNLDEGDSSPGGDEATAVLLDDPSAWVVD